jgi:hypothetical protein
MSIVQMFIGALSSAFAISLLHLLEIIRESIQKVGQREDEHVTELSSVQMLGDREVEALEIKRMGIAGPDVSRG